MAMTEDQKARLWREALSKLQSDSAASLNGMTNGVVHEMRSLIATLQDIDDQHTVDKKPVTTGLHGDNLRSQIPKVLQMFADLERKQKWYDGLTAEVKRCKDAE